MRREELIAKALSGLRTDRQRAITLAEQRRALAYEKIPGCWRWITCPSRPVSHWRGWAPPVPARRSWPKSRRSWTRSRRSGPRC